MNNLSIDLVIILKVLSSWNYLYTPSVTLFAYNVNFTNNFQFLKKVIVQDMEILVSTDSITTF